MCHLAWRDAGHPGGSAGHRRVHPSTIRSGSRAFTCTIAPWDPTMRSPSPSSRLALPFVTRAEVNTKSATPSSEAILRTSSSTRTPCTADMLRPYRRGRSAAPQFPTSRRTRFRRSQVACASSSASGTLWSTEGTNSGHKRAESAGPRRSWATIDGRRRALSTCSGARPCLHKTCGAQLVGPVDEVHVHGAILADGGASSPVSWA
jgi:hypothetical protein